MLAWARNIAMMAIPSTWKVSPWIQKILRHTFGRTLFLNSGSARESGHLPSQVKFDLSLNFLFFNIGLMCSTKWIEQELSTCWRGSRYFTLSKQILAFSIIYPLISHPCWWSNLTVLVCVFACRCSYTLSEMYSVRWQNTRQRWSLWSKNYKWIMPGQGLSLGVRAMHFFDNRLLS